MAQHAARRDVDGATAILPVLEAALESSVVCFSGIFFFLLLVLFLEIVVRHARSIRRDRVVESVYDWLSKWSVWVLHHQEIFFDLVVCRGGGPLQGREDSLIKEAVYDEEEESDGEEQ